MGKVFRKKLIFQRWIDIIGLGFIACLTVAYLDHNILRKMAAYFDAVGTGWNFIVLIIYFIIPLAIWYILRAMGGFRLKDFSIIYSFSNPPTWYSAVIGLLLYPTLSFYLRYTSTYSGYQIRYSICLFGALFGIGTIIPWTYIRFFFMSWRNSSPLGLNDGINLTQFSFDNLIKWLKKEEPIDDVGHDLFDARVCARRIVMALRENKSISLIGPYGSGKTTILNLARNDLKSDFSKIVIFVSGWGYEDKKLIGYILRCAVKEISRQTDCLGLYCVPFELQNTFFSNSWGVFDFLKLIFTFETTEGLIDRITSTLERSNKNLIIFLEDIDRNHESNIQDQLFSLFNYFNKSDRVSFVITYGGK